MAKPKYITHLSIAWIAAIGACNVFFIQDWSKTILTPDINTLLFSGYNIPFCAGLLCHKFRNSLGFIQWPSLLAAGACYGIYALSISTPLTIISLTCGGCITIMAMVNCFNNIEPSPTISSLLWLGDRSFGIYLLHAPLISIITTEIIKKTNSDPTTSSIAILLIATAAATGFASIELTTYKYLFKKKTGKLKAAHLIHP